MNINPCKMSPASLVRKMVRNILVVLAYLLVAGNALPKLEKFGKFKPDGRIVGGNLTSIEDNPWQVSIQIKGFGHNCGGSLIAPDIILTAAHCVYGYQIDSLEIVSGTDDLLADYAVRTQVKEGVAHENYSDAGFSYDIGYIRLGEALVYSEKTQPISLTDSEPADDATVRVTGWGTLSEDDWESPNLLYGVDINIVAREECAKDYSPDVEVDTTMICAGVPEGGKDSCSGDSGGPLTINGTLVGVVSWGRGCAEKGYPGVYTNVALFRQWIKDHTGV